MNPKIGFTHKINQNQLSYISLGIANNEPNRNDYVESSPNSRPHEETLYDTEIGYTQTGNKIIFSANLYFMNYKNQLVITGKLNDVGARTHVNVTESFRKGIEIEGVYTLTNKLTWGANMTLSENKIITPFIEHIDNWDNENIKKVINELTNEFDIKISELAQPLRVAITGTTISPSIDDTVRLLGRKRTLERLNNAIKFIESHASS